VRGRRWVGGIGSGGTGGGAAACAHRAQWGLCVRPANGMGSWERVRLGLIGLGAARPCCDKAHRLGQMWCSMTHNHRRPNTTS